MKNELDISSRSTDPLARRLSNFTERPFTFEGVRCGSMEGFLQSLKFEDLHLQEQVAALVGYRAFKFGNEHGNGWKKEQVLWWRGVSYARLGAGYPILITRAYAAQFVQSNDLKDDLRASIGKILRHRQGKNDPTDTVLTEGEYIKNLNLLRFSLVEQDHGTMGDPRPDDPEQREAVSDPSSP